MDEQTRAELENVIDRQIAKHEIKKHLENQEKEHYDLTMKKHLYLGLVIGWGIGFVMMLIVFVAVYR